jgi:aldehyde dehydrogenase (NAD+)
MAAATFSSYEPISGKVVGEFPVCDAGAVAETVARARVAADWWRQLGFAGRRDRLRGFAGQIARRLPELAALVARENGKSDDDARLELVISIDQLRWAAAHAERVLRRRSVKPGILLPNTAASVEYQPYGVVGVIGPWNYPVFTPMGSIAYALSAGNAVVFKPSEFTPAVGTWLADAFAKVVPEQPVLQVVTGYGDTGAALARSGVDKMAFTGSTATGRRVMAACAETLTPVVIEAGGKDAMVVAEDADIDAAADAALWGGCFNSGQSCVGIERVYVVAPVYDAFVARIAELARDVRAEKNYGAMTTPEQVDVVRRHVEDALSRGARAVVGGPESIRPPFVDPVVLVDVPDDAPAVQEETFGPTLTVTRVSDVDDAIAKANGTPYGLAGSVFSRERGEQLARRMRAGVVSVNSALTFMGVPALPFGGVGDSGFGRIHGADGLREFARPHSVARQRVAPPLAVMTYQHTARPLRTLVAGVRLWAGRRRGDSE